MCWTLSIVFFLQRYTLRDWISKNTLHSDFCKRLLDYIFKKGLTWTFVSSSKFGVRYFPDGFLFDSGGPAYFPTQNIYLEVLAYLVSSTSFYFLKALNPTLNFQCGNIISLPFNNDSTINNGTSRN